MSQVREGEREGKDWRGKRGRRKGRRIFRFCDVLKNLSFALIFSSSLLPFFLHSFLCLFPSLLLPSLFPPLSLSIKNDLTTVEKVTCAHNSFYLH